MALLDSLGLMEKLALDGRPAFSVTPVKEHKLGSVPCWFNPASDRYEWISSIPGLETFSCPAAHLASEFDAELHARHRHDRRYLRVKDYEERREKQEAKAAQERQIAAMLAMAGAGRVAAGQSFTEAALDMGMPTITEANFPAGDPNENWSSREVKNWLAFHGKLVPVSDDLGTALDAVHVQTQTIYYCKAAGCSRFFDNDNARSTHQSRDHKE